MFRCLIKYTDPSRMLVVKNLANYSPSSGSLQTLRLVCWVHKLTGIDHSGEKEVGQKYISVTIASREENPKSEIQIIPGDGRGKSLAPCNSALPFVLF
jgi:hypothetical protein